MQQAISKKEFLKITGRKKAKTSVRYINNGTFTQVFGKIKRQNAKKDLTVWGYERVEELNITVLKARIRFMRDRIDSGEFGEPGERPYVFAAHHLASLRRRLKELRGEK